LTWAELLPSLRAGLAVMALFVLALVVVRHYSAPIQAAVSAHSVLGVVVFVATSAIAVLLPTLTNLPLLPVAVLAWGPWWTALLLLSGWIAGAALSFWLGRHARDVIVRRFPAVRRHADIDRLIHPQHRLLSLVLLRMTFPVDVLSYALGLFSQRTTLAENVVSTTFGAAPFALLFAWVPTMSPGAQAAVFIASTLAFVVYVAWVLRRSGDTP
jgi:uncharacterized membrane protein YdjX (TVP38/TMEM64 family)